MRIWALAAALTLGTSSFAHSADPAMPMEEVPVTFSWTGAYVGLQAGYGWSDGVTTFPQDLPAIIYYDGSGAVGGAYAGYMHHFKSDVVAGVEIDALGSSVSESSGTLVNVNATPGVRAVSEIEYSASLRARLGYALGRFLPYATAGVAYTKSKTGFAFPTGSFEDTTEWAGWTVGGGIDYAFTDNIIARIEYRYADFGDQHYPDYIAPGVVISERNLSLKTNDIRLGVAYKF